ncbi:putative uncharacterized protein [Parachlamydia acanthamoebae UV-7]|uniref:DUF72 domain-containing protein n=1 Tax=Parachlamydia acanthamoebae (strain UV7) TaxID=765952 RepID=F8KZ15_PARAV|nr:putative uncharacterized protein [Parachlamydia acanthamoebae UV-7]
MNRDFMKKQSIHIGTSGWSYPHWKENFYPEEIKMKDWLNYYSSNFSTVEINSTFYRIPSISTVEKWTAQVPNNFLFSIKASQYITHRKRLHECEESLAYFYQTIRHFKEKMGPILFQLPPSFKMNKERLVDFISLLEKDLPCVFEFRNETWYNDDIYELLTKNKIALCITDLNGRLSPEEITAPFTYIRLHGPKEAYQGSYGSSQLKAWKKKIDKWTEKTVVYCYFDNDEKGYAIEDAKNLQNDFQKSSKIVTARY